MGFWRRLVCSNRGVFQGLVRRRWLGGVLLLIYIVLVVFKRGGPVFGKIRRIDLVGLGGELCWSVDRIKIMFCDLVYLFEFLNVTLKFRSVGQACWQFLGNLT